MTVEKYEQILRTLARITEGTRFHGHVYSVGGCERDRIMGRPIKDIDLVVDIENGGIDLAKYLHENGYTTTGIVVYENFGTAMFRLKDFPDEEIEVVHTRHECYRDPTRRQPTTGFGTITEDCCRRDFTMNAIYRSVATGQVFDLTDRGIEDIKTGTIRACDNQETIFGEDPLRQFRAARFCSQLGFDIEYYTAAGIRKNAKRIEIVSKERIKTEFDKILESDRPLVGLDILMESGLIRYGIPDLERVLSYKPNVTLIKKCVANMAIDSNCNTNKTLRKNILLTAMSLGEGGTALNPFMDDLKYSNDEKDTIADMLRAFRNYQSYEESAHDISKLRLMQLNLKRTDYESALSLVSALGLTVTDKERNNRDMVGYKLPVNGDDIMEITGLKPGKDIGEYLVMLTDLALHATDMTKEEMLVVVSEDHKHKIQSGEYGKVAAVLDSAGFRKLALKIIKRHGNH